MYILISELHLSCWQMICWDQVTQVWKYIIYTRLNTEFNSPSTTICWQIQCKLAFDYITYDLVLLFFSQYQPLVITSYQWCQSLVITAYVNGQRQQSKAKTITKISRKDTNILSQCSSIMFCALTNKDMTFWLYTSKEQFTAKLLIILLQIHYLMIIAGQLLCTEN